MSERTNSKSETAAIHNGLDHLVVVGASAGGVEALGVLVGSLNAGLKAPVVIAQHLDPNRASHLASILERRSKLPVRMVGESTKLENATVYVVPSNRHVVIRDGHVELDLDHGLRPRPSVDLLLSTAAQNYGERVIAVILTGSGRDGAAGAVDVKQAGGTVIIQNPKTAVHPSMPLALPPTVVDHVVELESIGSVLQDILTGVDLAATPPDQDVFSGVLAMVSRQSGIDFSQYKPSTVMRRIGRRMALRRTGTLAEYRDYLETHPGEVGELSRSLIIKVTDFFRDPEAFGFIRNDILPRLIESGRDRGRVLRVWSAGCSTGEEAYSLAFLLSDTLGSELPEWSVKIFATDVDDGAITFARRGLYPANTLQNLPEEYRSKFLESSELGTRISRPLRQMVIFGRQDLNHGTPFPRIDLVVCRNLLIYFKPELQQEVLDLFAYSLHQTQGYLFLGRAETARPSNAVFEQVNKKWKVYRCLAGPVHFPTLPRDGMMAGVLDKPVKRRAEAPARAMAPASDAEVNQIRRVGEMLRFIPTGVVVIDSGYRIVTMNGTARRLLGIRESAADQDFLHLARGLPYHEVRAAVDQVFRDRVALTLSEIDFNLAGLGNRWLSLHFAPVQFEHVPSEWVLVSVTECTEMVALKRRVSEIQDEQKQLAEELGSSNRRLIDLNKDLQDANEELQATNEEMMLAQEELQATNEEFEATNEELQATNEELETNSEELQATNEELETTNAELVSRTQELQEVTRVLTHDRVRLADDVELAPFYIFVLRGAKLVVESISPPLGTLFGGAEALGRPFQAICPSNLSVVLEGVRSVYREGAPWNSSRLPVSIDDSPEGRTERYYVFTAVPTPAGAKGEPVDNVVLYAEDVTQYGAFEDAERLERIRLMIENVGQVGLSLYDAATRKLLLASPSARAIFRALEGWSADQVIGKTWEELFRDTSANASRHFHEVVRTRVPLRLPPIRTVQGDSERIWDCSLIPISLDPGSAVSYLMMSAVEITDQAHARADLEHLDRMKDDFLSLASHELRTPLSPLRIYAEVLSKLLLDEKRGDGWEGQVREVLGKFQRQIAHLARLSDDLLDVARLQSGKFSIVRKPVDVKRLLANVAELAMSSSPKPPVRVQVPDIPGKVTVQGDEERLSQLILNLLTNAARHAPDSPHIELRLELAPSEHKRAKILVRDFGPGIDSETMRHLFTRYGQKTGESGARSGLGLGLFIARGIAEQHGGTIDVESTPGQGTTFIVELPTS